MTPRETLVAKIMERTHACSGRAVFVDPVILHKLIDEVLRPEAPALPVTGVEFALAVTDYLRGLGVVIPTAGMVQSAINGTLTAWHLRP